MVESYYQLYNENRAKTTRCFPVEVVTLGFSFIEKLRELALLELNV
jgi:hypothetical protein